MLLAHCHIMQFGLAVHSFAYTGWKTTRFNAEDGVCRDCCHGVWPSGAGIISNYIFQLDKTGVTGN